MSDDPLKGEAKALFKAVERKLLGRMKAYERSAKSSARAGLYGDAARYDAKATEVAYIAVGIQHILKGRKP